MLNSFFLFDLFLKNSANDMFKCVVESERKEDRMQNREALHPSRKRRKWWLESKHRTCTVLDTVDHKVHFYLTMDNDTLPLFQ